MFTSIDAGRTAIQKKATKHETQMKRQQGVFLLEALIAILIFAFGILGIVALGATAIGAQNDAEYRTEASNYTGEIIGLIWANVNRVPALAPDPGFAVDAVSLATFQHLPNTASGDPCSFSGATSVDTMVTDWAARVSTISATSKGLPGATARQQVLVDTASDNRVTVTVCWQGPNDAVPRRHTVVTYVN